VPVWPLRFQDARRAEKKKLSYKGAGRVSKAVKKRLFLSVLHFSKGSEPAKRGHEFLLLGSRTFGTFRTESPLLAPVAPGAHFPQTAAL
jgi:hypothetical protein